jgi:hypothetical protein
MLSESSSWRGYCIDCQLNQPDVTSEATTTIAEHATLTFMFIVVDQRREDRLVLLSVHAIDAIREPHIRNRRRVRPTHLPSASTWMFLQRSNSCLNSFSLSPDGRITQCAE